MRFGIYFFLLMTVVFLTTNSLLAQEDTTIGVFTEVSGTVERKAKTSEVLELLTQRSPKLTLYHNDTVTTGKDGQARIGLRDGIDIALGPNTVLVFKKDDNSITAELEQGKIRIYSKSNAFMLKTPYYSFTSTNTSYEVTATSQNEISVFCIEGSLSITGPHGFQILLKEGQVISAKYNDEKKEFQVTANNHNEEEVNCRAKDKEYKIGPGNILWVDSNLNVRGKENVTVIRLPELEEPKDGPYEDASDIHELPFVSPKKP